jgi:Cof subfamily protein (haloacid dehalogenase superfamily)
MIKALFFDIDGTLVSFETHLIPESTIEAIIAARAKGIKIFISTGRPKAIINNLQQLEEKNLIDGYVTMNGAYCFVGDEVIDSHQLPHQAVKEIAHYVSQIPEAGIFVTAKHIYVNQPTPLMEYLFYDTLHVDPIAEISIEEALQKEVYQMTPFITFEQEKEILSKVKGCMAGRWHPAFTDINVAGCNKEHGLMMFAQHFGLKREELMCFGDGGNDISMLQYAGTGVAMGNAEEEIKTQADYITSSVDDDGITRALQHFNII